MDNKNINKKLYELRKENNLTQLQLAEKINVSDKTISKWETGASSPDIEMIKIICKTFNIKTSEFLEEVSKKPKKKFEFKKTLLILKNNFIKLFSIFSYFFLIIFFINNYNTVNIYEIKADEGDISIESGYFIKTTVKNSLTINNIRVKNLDYETTSSKIKLYTFVGNNNKTYFYESDKIDNILIEELSKEGDRLVKNIVNALPKFLNIEIELVDSNNKIHTYKTKLLLRNSYSNKYLIQKPKDKLVTASPKEAKVPMVDAVTLSNKGFLKVSGANTYWKRLKSYDLYFDLELEKMYYSFEKNNIKYNYAYKYNDNIISVLKIKQDKFSKRQVIESYEYYIMKDELDCKEGKCTDYLNISKEMKTVFNDTLGIKK